jgi:hypothetical protein
VRELAQAPPPPLALGEELERAQAPQRSKVVAGDASPVIEWGRGSFGRVVPAALEVDPPLTAFEIDALAGGVSGAPGGPTEALAPGASARATVAYKQLLLNDGTAEFPRDIVADLGKRIERLQIAMAAALPQSKEKTEFIFSLLLACQALRKVADVPAGTALEEDVDEFINMLGMLEFLYKQYKQSDPLRAPTTAEARDFFFIADQFHVLE